MILRETLLKVSRFLLAGYAFLLPFQRLLYFPDLEYKLQLPEIVFVLLLLTSLPLLSGKLLAGMWLVGILPLWAWMTAIYHGDADGWQEAAHLTYLFLLAWVAGSIIMQSEKGTTKSILKIFVWGVVFQCVMSMVAFMLKMNLINTSLVMTYRDYPLLGDIYRIQGFTSHPIALGNLCITALMLILVFKRRKRWLTGSVLMLGLMLTSSKAVLIAGAVVFFMAVLMPEGLHRIRLALEKNPLQPESITRVQGPMMTKNWLFIFSGLFLLGIHLYLTHFTLPVSQDKAASKSQAVYWNDEIVSKRGDKNIYGTAYYFLKQSAWEAVKEHPFMGVGGGNFNDYNESKYANNKNKARLATYDPHSLYFGIAAEYGLPGLTILIAIIIYSLRNITATIKKLPTEGVLVALMAIFIFYILEGISTDILNNRQLWLLAGLYVGKWVR